MEEGMQRVMTPDHKAWPQFLADLRRAVPGEGRCSGTFAYAKTLLQAFPDVNWEHTFLFFLDHGAACDCEIVRTIEEVWKTARRRRGETV
jgi:hypothetical protein